jgi:competence protein ComEC
VPAVVDLLLLAALAAVGGACFIVAPFASAVTLAAVLVVLGKRLGRIGRLVVVTAFALGALRARSELGDYQRAWQRARDSIGSPQRCAVEATIESSPALLDGNLSYRATLSSLDCEGSKQAGPVQARLVGPPGLELGRGDRIELVGDLGIIEARQNHDLASPWPSLARREAVVSGVVFDGAVLERGHGLARRVDAGRDHVRARIQATFPSGAEPFARALVLGESDLAAEDDEAFRKAGLMHILAVSGTHLVFAVVALVRALTFLLVRVEALSVRFDVSRLGSAAGVLLSLLYADFAGGSGSAFRAAFMLSAAFLAKALGRASSAERSLGWAFLVGWLFDPLTAFDISFLLSAAATAGLLWLGPHLAAPCERLPSRVGRFVAESVAATVASMLPCAPLLAVMSPDLTLAGIFANVLAAPFGECISLPLCLLHTVLAPFPPLERGVALVASGALAVKQIAHEAAQIQGLDVRTPPPGAWHFALLVVAGAGFLRALAERRHEPSLELAGRRLPALTPCAWLAGAALGLLVLELGARRAGAPVGELRITALDIGQGDSTLIDLPDGQLWLVDGGGIVGSPVDPGTRVVLPTLRARRRERLDVMILSHPHPDHFLGLLSVMRGVEVGELWDTGQGEAHGAGPEYAKLLAAARERGVRIRRPDELCGARNLPGGARVRVLAPCPSYLEERGANDNSFVVKLELGRRSFLLMGDAEEALEHDLVARDRAHLRTDVLKVGHHGSRTSSTEALLAAARPELATVSTGLRNRFGHPHEPAMKRLDRYGVLTLRTDRLGSLTITTDGTALVTSASGHWAQELAQSDSSSSTHKQMSHSSTQPTHRYAAEHSPPGSGSGSGSGSRPAHST